MKILFHFLFLVVVATVAQAVSIQTQVYIKRTGGDQAGPNNELITTIMEMGNGRAQQSTTPATVPTNNVFPGSLGMLIAEDTFAGAGLPSGIRVRVIEDDGPTSKDDGVCNVKISTQFTTTPIVVECKREANDGLGDINIINVRVRVI